MILSTIKPGDNIILPRNVHKSAINSLILAIGEPIMSPGELITRERIDYIKLLKKNKAYMTDMSDSELKTILVIKNQINKIVKF